MQSGSSFCQALAETLKVNSCITKIHLADNDIGEEGAKAWSPDRSIRLSLVERIFHEDFSYQIFDLSHVIESKSLYLAVPFVRGLG